MTDAIVVHYPGMWAVESPQHPGIAAGRPNLEDAIALALELLPEASVARAVLVDGPDGKEYRIILRDTDGERARVATQIEGSIAAGYSLNPEALHPNAAGEYDVVAALPADRFGDLYSLVALGESALFVSLGAEDADMVAISSFQVGRSAGVSRTTLEDLGLSEGSTIDEVLNALIGVSAAKLRAVIVEMVPC